MEKMTENMETKLYQPNDVIQGVGIVQENGEPGWETAWPHWENVAEGDYIYGAVIVLKENGEKVLCDARTGVVLTESEIPERYGNQVFDYDDKEKKFIQQELSDFQKLSMHSMEKFWNTSEENKAWKDL